MELTKIRYERFELCDTVSSTSLSACMVIIIIIIMCCYRSQIYNYNSYFIHCINLFLSVTIVITLCVTIYMHVYTIAKTLPKTWINEVLP